MRRLRHLGVVALAAAPLLVLVLILAGGDPSATVWGVLLWLAGLLLFAGWSWRATVSPIDDMLRDLDAEGPQEARWLVRDLRANAELFRDERNRMAALLEDLSSGLGEGLVVVGPELKIRLINQVALRFCGVERLRPETHLLEILREPEVVEVFEKAARGGRPRPVFLENPRGLWEVRASPLRDGGTVGLLSDVSLIRRASEFRRRFVQDLSHELRSPLAVLRTTVEAMEDELAADSAEMLIRQVERIDRLASELNELASIEAGQVDLELEAVTVAEVVGEVTADFRPEARRAEVELETDVPEELRCRCDRRGLYRVMSNLMDNAIKYNRAGGWVRIRARRTGETATIQIVDSGEGIPTGELQAVLQRFYRIDRARTPGRGGLGLGLAIVKHMVQHMGGTLALDSREGVGTTVSLSFPGC